MRLHPFIAAAALLAVPLPLTTFAQSNPPAASAPATRSLPEIRRDIESASKELHSLASSPKDLLDPAKRAELAPKMLPLLNRVENLMQEFAQADPALKGRIAVQRYQLLAMKSLLGDTTADAVLKEGANSPDPRLANAAKTASLVADWVRTAQDPAGQAKVLDRTEDLVKANPTDPNVALLLVSYVQFGAASAENRGRAMKMINEDLKGPFAEQVREQMAKSAAATRP